MNEMKTDLNYELQAAIVAGRSAAREGAGSFHQVASPEVEAKLNRLLVVVMAAFGTVMVTIGVLGFLLF